MQSSLLFKALSLTCSRQHHRLQNLFKVTKMFSIYTEINVRRETIFRTSEKYRTVSPSRNNFQIPHKSMTCWLITEFRVFAISRTRSICSNIKISDQFIEIRYQYDIPNKRVKFITNDRQFFVFKTVWHRRLNCVVSKYAWKIDKIDTLINKQNFYIVS